MRPQPWAVVRSMTLVAVTFCLLVQLCAAALQCSTGDAACFCRLVNGERVAQPTTIRPTCRKVLSFQGKQRIVDIYFPSDISSQPGARFTPWVHLHGVQLGKWWLDGHPEWKSSWPAPMGGNADASRMNALTGSPITSDDGKADPTAGLVKRPGYILVVPQATGDVSTGQMWNSLFWPCMGEGRCVDSSVDDVGFLTQLLQGGGGLAQLLPGVALTPKAVLSGYSNGGMLAQALLCKQPGVTDRLAGVALLGTMLGSSFADSECQRRLPRGLPMLWLHGVQDAVLPYNPGGSSMGVPALGAEAAMKLWAARSGCTDAKQQQRQQKQGGGTAKQQSQRQDDGAPYFTDVAAGVSCTNLCGDAKAPPVVLCSVAGAGHGMWDQPATGYSAGMMHWAFGGFQGQGPKPL